MEVNILTAEEARSEHWHISTLNTRNIQNRFFSAFFLKKKKKNRCFLKNSSDRLYFNAPSRYKDLGKATIQIQLLLHGGNMAFATLTAVPKLTCELVILYVPVQLCFSVAKVLLIVYINRKV